MKLNEMFPSNLLKAADVTEAGGELVLTIHNIEIREFDSDDGGKERKPVIFFADDKRMVLNKTNANALAAMFGDDTDLWLNKEITLHVQEVPFGGKTVPAIRVKNLNSKDVLITSYWTKARALGFTREEGIKHLQQFEGDFAKALVGLEGNPF